MMPVFRLRWSIGLVMGIACGGTLLADEAGDAKEILLTSGVRAGLCLHLGCGRQASAGLTAALAENPNFMVHALAFDEAALARAREKIEAKGVLGRAIAEKVACNPLPYLRNLANLVVVEDLASLTAQGVTREEILRVLAPGGVLLVKEGGAWTKAVKPRPQEMDDWSHPQHGADGNMVSKDKLVRFPLGLRWLGGLPRGLYATWGQYGGSWVIAGGRCFTFSKSEVENLESATKDTFLSARDAFNGLPLWKINCGKSVSAVHSNWRNPGQPVADASRVYAVQNNKNIIAVEAASGRILHTFATQYPAVRLALLEGALLASCWKGMDRVSGWGAFSPKPDTGSLQAFDAKTGAPKWSAPLAPRMLVASHGMVYALTKQCQVVGLDLKTGKEKWRVPHTAFGTKPDLQLNCAGPGFVVIAKQKRPHAVFVLAAEDGKVLWKVQPARRSIWTPLIDGLLWCDGKKYDPLTGKAKGRIPAGMPFEFGNGRSLLDHFPTGGDERECTQSVVVGPYICRTRRCAYQEIYLEDGRPKVKLHRYRATRGACGQGATPANGMFYTGPGAGCTCYAGQPPGFMAFGPSGALPVAADFEKPHLLEKGPAFGAVAEDAPGDGGWPTYRHDAERTAATTTRVPEELKELWRVQVALPPGKGPVAQEWKARLGSCLSAPVVAGGLVFAAGTDAGQLVAIDAVKGKKVWAVTLGGRIDSPPTIHKGLCLIGCHDGWVYALRAKDGRLAWRLRVAPWERRMPVNGQIESVWPVIGAVLVHKNVAFANAGRTTESDGGIAVMAFDPATGAQRWCKAIAPGPNRRNDLLILQDGELGLTNNLRVNPQTGRVRQNWDFRGGNSKGKPGFDILDGTWTVRPGRSRAGDIFREGGAAFIQGRAASNLMAWNDKLIVTQSYAITREKAEMAENKDRFDFHSWVNAWARPFPKEPPPDAKSDEKVPQTQLPKIRARVKKGRFPLKKADYLWKPQLGPCRVEAMALAGNVALYAGRQSAPPWARIPMKTPVKCFLLVNSLADGKKLSEIALDCPPTYDGLAVAEGKVFLSLQNGMLVCFGK